MGYIYQADVYCDDCGDSICGKLHAQGSAPEDTMDHSSYDSDDFPKSADVEHEESDTPMYCAKCGKFLRNPLTRDGYQYVQEKLNETSVSRFSQLSPVLNDWAHWYNFTYWDQVDCDDYFQDDQKRTPGWFSSEAF